MQADGANGRVEVLLVEDNPGDARLTREALDEGGGMSCLRVVDNGADAVAYLRRQGPYARAPRPRLILLDLNLPRKHGCDVLAEIKADEDLRMIPVVVLTTSAAEHDVRRAYSLHANCYVTKPADFDAFVALMRSIQEFWLSIARIPVPHEG